MANDSPFNNKTDVPRKGVLSSSGGAPRVVEGQEDRGTHHAATGHPTTGHAAGSNTDLDENGAVIQPDSREVAGEKVVSIFGAYSNTRGVEHPALEDLQEVRGDSDVHFIHRDIMATKPVFPTGRLPNKSKKSTPYPDDNEEVTDHNTGRINPYEEGYAGAHTAYASQDKIKGHFQSSLDAFKEGDSQTAATEYISGQRGLLATDQAPRDVLAGDLLAHCLKYQETALGSFQHYGEDTFVLDYGTNKLGDRKFLRKKLQHLQLMQQLQGQLNNGQLDSLEEALMQNGQELQTLGFEEIQFINSVTDKLPDAIEEYEFTQQRMAQERGIEQGQGYGREGT